MKKILILCLALVFVMLLNASCGAVNTGEEDAPKAADNAETQPAADDSEPADDTETAGLPNDPDSPGTGDTDGEDPGDTTGADTIGEVKIKEEFTELMTFDSDGISFKLPANHDGTYFKDCGAPCVVMFDRYNNHVVAYDEYDSYAPIEKKEAGGYVYDYQKFNYLGIEDWRIYVIKIAFTESRNEMEHCFYRILYNVYAKDYDDAQVEKFMSTIQFKYY